MARAQALRGSHMARAQTLHGSHIARAQALHGSHMARAQALHGSHMVRPQALHGSHTASRPTCHLCLFQTGGIALLGYKSSRKGSSMHRHLLLPWGRFCPAVAPGPSKVHMVSSHQLLGCTTPHGRIGRTQTLCCQPMLAWQDLHNGQCTHHITGRLPGRPPALPLPPAMSATPCTPIWTYHAPCACSNPPPLLSLLLAALA